MKSNKKFHIIIAVVLTALVVAAAVYLWRISAMKRMKSEQLLYDQELQFKDVVINNVKIRIARIEDALSGSPDKLPADLLKIYSYNAQADIGTVGFCLVAPNDYTLTQKLGLAADVLMKYAFGKGLIEIKRIEQRGDKKIAVVDLRETKDYPDAWKGQYFQGSTGGTATTFILSNTFLQPDYTGAWIDGVEFLYEGKAINANEWDHIFLHGTKYRSG